MSHAHPTQSATLKRAARLCESTLLTAACGHRPSGSPGRSPHRYPGSLQAPSPHVGAEGALSLSWRTPSQKRLKLQRAVRHHLSRSHRVGERHGRCLRAQGPVRPRRGGWRRDKEHADAGRTAQTLLRQQQPGTSHPAVTPHRPRGRYAPCPVSTHLSGAASPGRAGRPLLPAGRRGPAGGSGAAAAAGGRPRRRPERSRNRAGPSRGSARNSGTCSQRDGAGHSRTGWDREGSVAQQLPRPPRGRAYRGGGSAHIGHYHPHPRGRDQEQTNSPGTAALTPSPPAKTDGAVLSALSRRSRCRWRRTLP